MVVPSGRCHLFQFQVGVSGQLSSTIVSKGIHRRRLSISNRIRLGAIYSRRRYIAFDTSIDPSIYAIAPPLRRSCPIHLNVIGEAIFNPIMTMLMTLLTSSCSTVGLHRFSTLKSHYCNPHTQREPNGRPHKTIPFRLARSSLMRA